MVAELGIDRRKFLVVAGGAAALLLTPGWLDGKAVAHPSPENVTLGEGEILLDAVSYRDQLWTLVQTPSKTILRSSTGIVPQFPIGFQAESLGRSGSKIVVGGYRMRSLDQSFLEGNYSALVSSTGLESLLTQPGLDNWPTEGVREFQTNELVPAYAVLSNGVWSAPIDVPNLSDVAGSVTSVVGSGNSLELVVDSLLDSSMRDSTTEILQVTVSTQSRSSERVHIADTVHGTSAVLGQDDNTAYVVASSLGAKRIIGVGDDVPEIEFESDLNLLSVWAEDGKVDLFVESENGKIGSIPLEEANRLDGDIGSHLEQTELGKRSLGEDVVLAYEMGEENS